MFFFFLGRKSMPVVKLRKRFAPVLSAHANNSPQAVPEQRMDPALNM